MPRSKIHCLLIVATLAAAFATAAPILSTDAQKEIAAAIAAAPAPAEAATARQSDWSPGLVVALLAEGMKRQAKDPAAAEALYQLGQDVAAKIGDSRTEALAIFRRGNSLLARHSLRDSVPPLRQALTMQNAALSASGDAAKDKDRNSEAAETAISLAIALNDSGLGEEAMEVAVRAVQLAGQSDSDLISGRAYSAAGSAALSVGNNRAAVAYMLKALPIAEKLRNLSGQAAVLNNLGNASRQAYDFDAAIEYFQRSLAIKRQQGPGSYAASSLNNLGETALSQLKFDEADKYFREALDSIQTTAEEKIRPTVLVNIGVLTSQRGEYARSNDLFEEAIAVAEKEADRDSVQYSRLFEAGNYLMLHRAADAQAALDKGKPLIAQTGDPRLEMRYVIAQGDIDREERKIPEARTEYLNAIREYEAMRLTIAGDESQQASFADNTRYVYTDLVSLEADAKHNADAFRYAELSKSQVLLDDLNSGRADVARVLTPEETDRNKELLGYLSDLNLKLRSAEGQSRIYVGQQLDKIHFDYSTFRTGVYAAHPELALHRADPEPVSLGQAATLLPDEHTALVSYSIGENASYVFVLTRVAGKPVLRVHPLKTDADKLALRVSKWRDEIARHELGFGTLAHELYNTLLKPLEADLSSPTAKIDRLIVSPDAALWQIPFEALEDGAGKFVEEDYEVFYAPSATVLDRMRRVSAKRNGPLSLLALGNPAGGLRDAAIEVAGVGKLYPPGRSKVLTESAATEGALRANAGRYSVIHIAAHGKYNDSQPLFSYLELAPGRAGAATSDDGNLEAREIMDLHLNAKLVILSGCETARGSGSGVGIAGMSWSIFIAGAPTTIASLWKLDSKSTSLLMMDLHKGITRGQTTAKSLRDAKLALLKNPAYRHPFYWAGFIGIGAGN